MMKKIFMALIMLMLAIPSLAAEHAVRPPGDCPNNGDGSAWSCAATPGGAGAYNTIPRAVVHGDTYYVAAGTYGDQIVGAAYTGSDFAYIKKATTDAHGSLDGWSNDYASGQATFTYMWLRGHYLDIDGVTGSGTSGYGFKVERPYSALEYTGDVFGVLFYGSSSPYGLKYVNLKHVEISMVSGGCTTYDEIKDAGVYTPRSYTIKMVRQTNSYVTIANCYIYGGSTNAHILYGNYITLRDNYWGESCSRSWSHGQQISSAYMAYFYIYNNEFHNSDAYVLGMHQAASPATLAGGNRYVAFYNNIIVGGIGAAVMAESGEYDGITNSTFHHNTFVNTTCPGENCIDTGNQTNVESTKSYAYNNLFYNVTAATIGQYCGTNHTAGCVVHDYNAFLDSTGYEATVAGEAHAQVDPTADNPLNSDYTINSTADAANDAHVINTGKTDLDVLYKDDAAGNERDATPDIGAFESGGSEDTTPPTISSATINAAGDTLTIAFSEIVNVSTSTGFTLNMSGGAAGLTYVSGSGTNSLVYLITGRNIDTAETGTLDYVTVANGIEDASGNDLASTGESDIAVTNNSTYSPSATTYTVTPSSSSGGCAISPATPQAVVSGETTQFTCTAMGNYACTAWTGTCGGSGTNTLTTSAITGDCTVVQPCKKRSADIAIY